MDLRWDRLTEVGLLAWYVAALLRGRHDRVNVRVRDGGGGDDRRLYLTLSVRFSHCGRLSTCWCSARSNACILFEFFHAAFVQWS